MTDWAAIATAVGTFSLAAVGTATWRQNRSLVIATSEEAAASNSLVAETIQDRELRWEPVPSVRWPGHVVGSGGPDVPIELKNAGGGAAITCRLVIKQGPDGLDGWLSSAIDIAPGETVTIRVEQKLDSTTSTPLSTWQGEDGVGHNAESLGAIFTKDVLGTRYRFLVVRDGSDQVIIERRERWHPGRDPEPPWAGYRVIWPDYGVRRHEVQPDASTEPGKHNHVRRLSILKAFGLSK